MNRFFLISLFFLGGTNIYCQIQDENALSQLISGRGFDGKGGMPLARTTLPYNSDVPITPLASQVLRGVTNDITMDYLKELGVPPTKGEEIKIRQALDILNGSKIGEEFCKSVKMSGCSWDDFQSAKIQITSRDLKYHLPEPLETLLSIKYNNGDPDAAVPPPSRVNGKMILCLDKELLSKNPPAYISTFVLHELSHVQDNRTLGEAYDGFMSYYTEFKAVSTHLMIYDELLRSGKIRSDNSVGIEFILSVYRWKNGGPKPDPNYSIMIKGKKYSAAEIIATFLKQGDTGIAAVRRLIAFYYSYPVPTAINGQDLKYIRGITDFIKEIEPKYQAWFPSKPPAVVNPPAPQPYPLPQPQPGPQPQPQPPHPQPQPQPPSGGNDDGDGGHSGGGGGGGGEWTPPFNPNPHF